MLELVKSNCNEPEVRGQFGDICAEAVVSPKIQQRLGVESGDCFRFEAPYLVQLELLYNWKSKWQLIPIRIVAPDG